MRMKLDDQMHLIDDIWYFEHVPSNLSSRLICGSFGWRCVLKTHPEKVEAWLVCKWTTHSQFVWFSYLRFLKTSKKVSMDVNVNTNNVKYDTNKRWVIHNLSQQKMGNLQLFENFSFEEKGNPHSIPKKSNS